jgi:hypothetical protein
MACVSGSTLVEKELSQHELLFVDKVAAAHIHLNCALLMLCFVVSMSCKRAQASQHIEDCF